MDGRVTPVSVRSWKIRIPSHRGGTLHRKHCPTGSHVTWCHVMHLFAAFHVSEVNAGLKTIKNQQSKLSCFERQKEHTCSFQMNILQLFSVQTLIVWTELPLRHCLHFWLAPVSLPFTLTLCNTFASGKCRKFVGAFKKIYLEKCQCNNWNENGIFCDQRRKKPDLVPQFAALAHQIRFSSFIFWFQLSYFLHTWFWCWFILFVAANSMCEVLTCAVPRSVSLSMFIKDCKRQDYRQLQLQFFPVFCSFFSFFHWKLENLSQ